MQAMATLESCRRDAHSEDARGVSDGWRHMWSITRALSSSGLVSLTLPAAFGT